jgi:hypothetical protein
MGFVERELNKIQSLLRTADARLYVELFAAQQALSWAIEPTGFKSPVDLILGSPGVPEGCLPDIGLALSSDIPVDCGPRQQRGRDAH